MTSPRGAVKPTGDALERGVLVGTCLEGCLLDEIQDHLDELSSLLSTAGGLEVGRLVVHRRRPHPATFIGSGKVEQLKGLAEEHEASLLVFDDDLSPAQTHKVETATGARVVNRSALILDIFARRARTREARTQVELAQLCYLLPRLTRRWTHLSRQAGGIGVRGVGETQLEIDRRLVRRRIGRLRSQLKRIDQARAERRKKRAGTFQVAIVGYTNAGKTTLLNALTGAGAATEDRLFATLDPLVRKLPLPGRSPGLLIDTVGFVRKLPHDLVASFRSTLQEAVVADLLLHVIDLSRGDHEAQAETTRKVLGELGLAGRPLIEVFNKIDNAGVPSRDRAARLHPEAFLVSARQGDGISQLREAISAAAPTGAARRGTETSLGVEEEEAVAHDRRSGG